MSPIVSVVMPVYNGEKYLNVALNSILTQTLTDLELIVINDSSTDLSRVILEEFAHHDARIRFYDNEKNLGLPTTLNRGLELARGEYIARMDQDDISSPERLEKQVQYMQTNLDVDVCGSWAELIRDRASEIWKYPTGHAEIFARMFFENTLIHPSVIMRSSALHQFGLSYDGSATHFEDYDLWSRALPLLRFANIPEVLLQYRLHGLNTSDLHADEQSEGRGRIYARMLTRLQLEYAEDDLSLHEKLGMHQYESDYAFVQSAYIWFGKLLHANKQVKLIPQPVFEAELARRWSQICSVTQDKPNLIFRSILSSPLPYKGSTGIVKIIRAFIYLLRQSSLYLGNLLRKAFLSKP